MGTFAERIVRPAVAPNIRPAAAPLPVKAPATEDRDVTVITGSGDGLINLAHSFSKNFSQQKHQIEQYRLVDIVRVFNPQDHSQYVDIEVTVYIQFITELGTVVTQTFGRPQNGEHQEVLQRDQRRDVRPEDRF